MKKTRKRLFPSPPCSV
jgi:hypothetical protein